MGSRRYSCESASKTLEWMNAISEFLRPFKPLLDAHVVNFFKDRLWEMVDEQWMECLRREPVVNLLKLPSGFFREHWPDTLKEFVCNLRSIVFPREPEALNLISPNLHVAALGTVLTQGMNLKKKHEVEILAAVISSIASTSGAQTVIDVGSGQGYLAQALSFQYQLTVVAIDASLHHATVTNARAERIRKHYTAKSVGNDQPKVPLTITCHVLSSDMLTALTNTSLPEEIMKHSSGTEISLEIDNVKRSVETDLTKDKKKSYNHFDGAGSLLVIAGLHACGDLSANMLRTFIDCEQVKALICLGCCYNLLSEGSASGLSGFPMSNAAILAGSELGKSARDIACQSAERWKSLTEDAALQNFDVHAFRAAFQMVLSKYFPDVLKSNPSIGRQGKALRRQRYKKILTSHLSAEGRAVVNSCDSTKQHILCKCSPLAKSDDVELTACCNIVPRDEIHCILDGHEFSMSNDFSEHQEAPVQQSDKFMLFEEFTKSGLGRLGYSLPEDTDLREIWEESLHYNELIGPFWSLRAALGPVVETYILLDRLLFLQEQDKSVEALLFPLFDPIISPRNVAIIARKK